MSEFINNTTLTGINKAVLSVVVSNELSNNDMNAFKIGGVNAAPASSTSGLTIGVRQIDLGQRDANGQPTALALQGETLLARAIIASGYAGTIQTEQSTINNAFSIAAAVMNAGTGVSLANVNFGTLTAYDGSSVTGAALNNALGTSNAAQNVILGDADNEITQLVGSVTSFVTNYVTNTAEANALDPNSAQFDPSAFMLTTDYGNQFGLSGPTASQHPLLDFLNTGSATFQGGLSFSMGNDISLGANLAGMEFATKYAQSDSGLMDIARREANALLAANQYISQNQGTLPSNQTILLPGNEGTLQTNFLSPNAASEFINLSQPINGDSTIASIAGTLGYVQITIPSGDTGTTAATITNSSGSINTYSMTGTATVLVDTLPGTLDATGGSNILVDPGFGGTLMDYAPNNMFIDLSNNGSVATGGNSTVDTEGNGTTISNTGSGCTDGIHCDGVVVNGSGDTVNVDDASAVTVDGSNDGIAGAAGSTIAVDGTDTVTANGATIDSAASSSNITVDGSGNTIADSAGVTGGTITAAGANTIDLSGGSITESNANTALTVNGSNDSITDASGDSLTVAGSDTVNQSNGSVTETAAGAGVTLNGSNNVASGVSGDTFSVFGSDIVDQTNGQVYEGSGGSTLTVSGSNDAITSVNGDVVNVYGSDTVNMSNGSIYEGTANAGLTVGGSGDGITGTGGDSITEYGSDTTNLSYGSVYEGTANTGFTVVGNYDAITGVSGDTESVYGSDTVNQTNGQVYEGYANADLTVSGNGDAISGQNGDALVEYGSNTAYLSNGSVQEGDAGVGFTTFGSNDGIVGANGDTAAVYGSDTVYQSNGSIYEGWSGYGLTNYGSGNAISGSGDSVALYGGGDTVYMSSGSVYEAYGSTGFNVVGSSDSVSGANGDAIGMYGSGDTVYESGGTVSENWGSDALTVDGQYDNVWGVGGDVLDIGGTQDSVHETGGAVDFMYGDMTGTVSGNSDTVDATWDHVNVYGSYDDVVGSGDNIDAYGTGDWSSGSYDYDYGSGFGGGPTGGYYGYYGFVRGIAGTAPGIDVIAQYDSAHGYTGAANAAKAAFNQAVASSDGQLASSAATLADDPIGALWANSTITWSFANASDGCTPSSPVSGAVQTQYQSVIEQAMQAWEAASGVSFQQVADGNGADIDIGWGTFDTASSNVIGYTTPQISVGQMQAGAILRMEDPAETALVDDGNGNLVYSDTGATLYQVALHEIGHALGLGDDSDPNSVMYYSLGSNNTTLDATDVAAIQAAYGPSSSSASALLLQSMASFGPQIAPPPLAPLFPPPEQTAQLAPSILN